MYPAEQIAGFRTLAEQGKTPRRLAMRSASLPPRAAHAEAGKPRPVPDG